MNKNQVKGFTLIELLIVIGIIAILATVVILTLNPAELLKQARDSTRTSDFATVKSALSLFGADVSTAATSMGSSTATAPAGWCYTSISNDAPATVARPALTTSCGGWLNTATTNIASSSESNKRKVDGTGWIPVNLNLISSGAPISAYPVDPVSPNSSSSHYIYAVGSSGGFVLKTQLESAKFASSSVNDGGPAAFNNLYEVGTQPGLDL